MGKPYFMHRRADGWPLCPNCDHDELASVVMFAWNGQGDRPTIADCLAGELFCYLCNWTSEAIR